MIWRNLNFTLEEKIHYWGKSNQFNLVVFHYLHEVSIIKDISTLSHWDYLDWTRLWVRTSALTWCKEWILILPCYRKSTIIISTSIWSFLLKTIFQHFVQHKTTICYKFFGILKSYSTWLVFVFLMPSLHQSHDKAIDFKSKNLPDKCWNILLSSIKH